MRRAPRPPESPWARARPRTMRPPRRVRPRPAGPDETLTLISLDSDQLLTDVREHPASGAPGYRSGVFVRCPVVLRWSSRLARLSLLSASAA